MPDGYTFLVMPEKLESSKPLAGVDAPAWTLRDPDGASLSLAELRGRVVVIDFWYLACLPCQRSMPKLDSLRRIYDPKGVTFVGIDVADSIGPVRAFLQRKKLGYRFLLGGHPTAHDYHVSSYPMVYVVGKGGKILSSHVGDSEDFAPEVASAIDQALRE